jgi:hypothetical protein
MEHKLNVTPPRSVDVTFRMTYNDLCFLEWMMHSKESRPNDPKDLLVRWRALFKQARAEHFPEEGDEGTTPEITGDLEKGPPLWSVTEFRSAFDADGRFKSRDGSLRVVFHHHPPKNRANLGTLFFHDGLCVYGEIDDQAGLPRPEPDGSPLRGMNWYLFFEDEPCLRISLDDGRITYVTRK